MATRSLCVPVGLLPSNFKYRFLQRMIFAAFRDIVNVVLPTSRRQCALILFEYKTGDLDIMLNMESVLVI